MNDTRLRGQIAQLVLLGAVAILALWFARNAYVGLQAQRIATGFGFLDHTAGFAIVQSLIPYSEASTYARALLVGLLNTLLVAAIGIVVATLIGFIVGIARLSGNWLVARLAAIYVEILRNIPVLLQIFFWYYAVLRNLPPLADGYALGDTFFLNNRGLFVPRLQAEPWAWAVAAGLAAGLGAAVVLRRWAAQRRVRTGTAPRILWPSLALAAGIPILAALATGVPFSVTLPAPAGFNIIGGIQVLPEFLALILALSFYTAAYIAEIVRAGIQGVARGQREAAAALGLKRGTALRLVVLPQAMRIIVPPLTSQYLNLTKNSSLAIAIAYPDLTAVFTGTVLNQTGQAIEVLSITMAIYLSISLATSALMNWYNRACALKGT